MNKLAFKIGTLATAGALFATSAFPAFAATRVRISGNGPGSTNTVKINVTKTKTITQTNFALVINAVTVDSSTGGNNASSNTGGNTHIETGDTSTAITVVTIGNVNISN